MSQAAIHEVYIDCSQLPAVRSSSAIKLSIAAAVSGEGVLMRSASSSTLLSEVSSFPSPCPEIILYGLLHWLIAAVVKPCTHLDSGG